MRNGRAENYCPKGLLCSGPQIWKMFGVCLSVVCHAHLAISGKPNQVLEFYEQYTCKKVVKHAYFSKIGRSFAIICNLLQSSAIFCNHLDHLNDRDVSIIYVLRSTQKALRATLPCGCFLINIRELVKTPLWTMRSVFLQQGVLINQFFFFFLFY